METFQLIKNFNAPTQAVNIVARVLSAEGKIESIEGKSQEEVNAMLLAYFDALFTRVTKEEIEALISEDSKKQIQEMMRAIFQ